MEEFKRKLYPFQVAGRDFLKSKYHAFLADEMGCGKSTQALAAAHALNLQRVAIVCPASVRGTWRQEIEDCLGVSALDRFVIGSYNLAAGQKFPAGRYDAIILDEAHFLKTTDSQRTQAIFGPGGLAAGAKIRWALSGTPVLNRPREIYPISQCLAAREIAPYNTYAAFTQRFCGAFFDGRGINTKGASHLDDLRKRLSVFMLRRTKKEVLRELPARIVSRIALEWDAETFAPVIAAEYEIADREAYLSSTHEDYAQLGDTSRIDKITGICKAPLVAAFVDELIETTQRKVVVITKHREVVRILDQELGHLFPAIYQGGMNDAQKKAAISKFQTDKDCWCIIGNMDAIGTGVDGLQKASADLVLAEFDWSPKKMEQVCDRIDRIGGIRTADNCINVYMPHVPGTLESAKLQVHFSKSAVIKALVGNDLGLVSREANIDYDLGLGSLGLL